MTGFRLGYAIATGRLFVISDNPLVEGKTIAWAISGREVCRNNPDPDCLAAKSIGRKVIDTIELLRQRITERFPGAGLAGVVAELLQIAKENSARAERISRRNMPLRVAIYALLAAGVGGLLWIVRLIDFSRTSADSVYSVLQGIEAAANLVVLMGAALFFLVTVEERLKRRRALERAA